MGNTFLLALSGGHIIIVVIGILLLFGGKKIPELMKGIGQGIKEFKDASNGSNENKDVAEKKD